MKSHIFLTVCSAALLINIAMSDDVAISNRLSRQLCNNFENSQTGKVVPDPSQSLPICPVFEKEGSRSEWVFNNCGGSSGGGDSGSLPGKPREGDEGDNNVGENQPSGNAEGDGGDDDYGERIVNGHEALPFTHPYVVYLRTEKFKGLSGVVYNSHTIIVHTFHLIENIKNTKNLDELKIHIGKHRSGKRENEGQIRFMCNYTDMPKTGVSVVHLYDPITLNNYADKLRLAKPNQASSLEKNCLVPGWGEDNKQAVDHLSPVLLEANATVTKCIEQTDFAYTNMCTNPVYCYADSGSPLLCTEKHRVYASGMAIATSRKKHVNCKQSKETIYNDFKLQDVHDWVEKTYQSAEGMCRPLLRNEVFV